MQFWYRKNSILAWCLLPLSWLFRFMVKQRRWWLERHRQVLSLPVIVVGNITVGGTGKTPMVIWLCHYLQTQGWQVGVVSRGYKARIKAFPKLITPKDTADQVGDEPILIATETDCQVVIDPNRNRAVNYLATHTDCNIIISDDGLQHYAMSRVLEIITVDGTRRFGNGHCLPAGPLREPIRRLYEADMVVGNGDAVDIHNHIMYKQLQPLKRVDGSGKTMSLKMLYGKTVNAVAGIGDPESMFKELIALGCEVHRHPFADHHQFTPTDFTFDNDNILIMTAKDAVKCCQFAKENWWYLPIVAEPNDAFIQALDKALVLIKLN